MAYIDEKDYKRRLTYNNDSIVIVDSLRKIPDIESFKADRGIIVLCKNGTIQFDYNGNSTEVNGGEGFYCAQGSVMSGLKPASDVCITVIAFKNDMAELLPISSRRYSFKAMLGAAPVIKLSDEEWQLIDNHLQLLCHWMLQEDKAFYDNIVRQQFTSLILCCFSIYMSVNHMNNDEKEVAVYSDSLTHRFVNMVSDSEGRVRRVDDYATRLNVTPKYLSVVVRNTLGQTPTYIIRSVCLQAIIHKLLHTTMSIQQISYDLCFPNPSFFGKYVKEHLGMTPLEYRQKYKC